MTQRKQNPMTMNILATTSHRRKRSFRKTAALVAVGAIGLAACGSDKAKTTTTTANSPSTAKFHGTLRIGAIPDQKIEKLQRQFSAVSDYLALHLPGIKAEYVPVTDYKAAVSGFVSTDLDLVWFGGLSGVQARLAVKGSEAIAQRDIDAKFTSVFIAKKSSGIATIADVAGLAALKGHSLTFGSEASTSGRLMPQSFLKTAGVDVDKDLKGKVGFSGSHDATIELVRAGTYEVGALNSSVWDKGVAAGTINTKDLVVLFRSPPFFDYHWVAQPALDAKYGNGFHDALSALILGLSADDPKAAAILELFGAKKFMTTQPSNYAAIEKIGREIGLIR